MGANATQERLTSENRRSILPADDPALALLEGRLAQLMADLRRAKANELNAIETFLGIDSRICRHCGKPHNRG